MNESVGVTIPSSLFSCAKINHLYDILKCLHKHHNPAHPKKTSPGEENSSKKKEKRIRSD